MTKEELKEVIEDIILPLYMEDIELSDALEKIMDMKSK